MNRRKQIQNISRKRGGQIMVAKSRRPGLWPLGAANGVSGGNDSLLPLNPLLTVIWSSPPKRYLLRQTWLWVARRARGRIVTPPTRLLSYQTRMEMMNNLTENYFQGIRYRSHYHLKHAGCHYPAPFTSPFPCKFLFHNILTRCFSGFDV